MHTFFKEIKASFYSALVFLKGKSSNFSYYGLNPSELTPEQARQPAILCLHGVKHNQSGWLKLAKKLRKKARGPIYTLNIRYDLKTEIDQVRSCIDEIKKHYAEHGQELRLRIIGHSFGGIIAASAYHLIEGVTIERIITIASRLRWFPHFARSQSQKLGDIINSFKEKIHDIPLYNIVADKDWLVPKEATLVVQDPAKYHIVKNTSHLSVLYDQETENKIIQWVA